jgi:hypothetical protein
LGSVIFDFVDDPDARFHRLLLAALSQMVAGSDRRGLFDVCRRPQDCEHAVARAGRRRTSLNDYRLLRST